MSASKEKRLNISNIKTLGILAGGGDLPVQLADACVQQSIEPFIVAFEGQAAPELLSKYNPVWVRLGAAGQVIKVLKEQGVSDLVLLGHIKRPSLTELRPDLTAAGFFAKAGVSALGDDGLLKALKAFLGTKGFTVHGAHQFLPGALAPEGVLGAVEPSEGDWEDIRRGVEVLKGMDGLDVGQSIIVQEGLVLGIEAAEGTDGLIARCKDLKREGRGGVLVKMSKPGQDKDLDLPTIGPDTIKNAAASGLAGIAIHADNSLLVEREAVARYANQHKMFIISFNPSKI